MSRPSHLPPTSPTQYCQSLRLTWWVTVASFLFIFILTPRTVLAANADSEPPTPTLIEQAYYAGVITADDRLLYLAYAVYEPASLPVEYRSSAPWSGTATVYELNRVLEQNGDISATEISAATQAELTRLLRSAAATVCDQPDAANSLNSANFRVNSGAIGGGLTAQDYADSLEETFGVEVSAYNWAKPPYCQANSANCGAANPWGRYPVQVVPLSPGLYGYVTSFGGQYTGLVGDNPSTAPVETSALASCMVLNSDYSGFPGGPQYSLDATTAHEFVHSIQFGYGDPGGQEDGMWYESSAAYMEDDVFDDINDNYQYLWPGFGICLGQYNDPSGTASVYSNWLFFRFVAERQGGTNLAGGGEEIMQAFWANVAAGQGGLRAYDNALQSKGANLRDTFHDYAIAAALMHACPSSTPYCFEEASGYIAAVGAIPATGQIGAVGDFYQGNLADHFAANWIALPVTGAYSLKLENLSAQGELRATIVAVTNDGLVKTPLPDLVGGNQSSLLMAYQPPAGATSVFAVITNQKWSADNPSSCTTTSYRLQLNAAVAVAVEVDAPADRAVEPGSSVNHSFRLTNAGLNRGDFDLQVVSSLGWANTTSVPSTITIGAGATVAVTITVTVPGDASAAQVEETELRAVNVSDAGVNDAAIVRTSLLGGRVHLPIVTYNEPPPPPPDIFYAVEDTTVLQGYPDESPCNTIDMWAGYDDALDPNGGIVRSLIMFDLSEIPAGTVINGAALHLYHRDSWDFPDRIRTVTAYGITSSWSACSTAWSNQPSIGSAYGSRDLPWSAGQWYAFDVTGLVRGWLNGSLPNYGIVMRGPEASGQDSSWRSFATMNSTNDPYLTIDYALATGESRPSSAPLTNGREGGALSAASTIIDVFGSEDADSAGCVIGGTLHKCRAWQ